MIGWFVVLVLVFVVIVGCVSVLESVDGLGEVFGFVLNGVVKVVVVIGDWLINLVWKFDIKVVEVKVSFEEVFEGVGMLMVFCEIFELVVVFVEFKEFFLGGLMMKVNIMIIYMVMFFGCLILEEMISVIGEVWVDDLLFGFECFKLVKK